MLMGDLHRGMLRCNVQWQNPTQAAPEPLALSSLVQSFLNTFKGPPRPQEMERILVKWPRTVDSYNGSLLLVIE